ncbi:MAG: replication-relaxation family protein, partial [Dehalococcoidia bacterium]|nr:replication-relaxation family protein [Dehalococcoidia bacterium]
QVIETLRRYRILRETEVHRLCFPTVKDQRKVQERLKKLSEEGYVGRRFPPVVPAREGANGATALEVAYWVERSGVERVLGSPLDDAHQERLKINRNLSKWKDHRLTHPLDVSAVRACLELAIGATPGIELAVWYDEHDRDAEGLLLQRKVLIPYGDSGREGPFTLRADACFVLEEPRTGRQQLFFVEVDEGTESARKRWKEQRVPAYRAYLGQGFEEDFEFHGQGFRVLTVTRSRAGKDNAKRKKNLVGATYRAGGRGQFLVATFDQVMPEGMVTGERFLAGEIWQRARLAEMKGGVEVALRGELFQ